MKNLVFFLFLLIGFSSCLMVEPLKLDKKITPLQLRDDWEISNPEKEGFETEKLAAAYDLFFSEEDGFRTAISLLVIRNGKIVAEGYCRNEEDHTRLNNIKSATKSVTSILLGQAIKDGYMEADVSKTILDYFPSFSEKYPDKSAITLFNILTMQTGIEYDNRIHTGELLVDIPKNSLDFILSKPIAFEQGNRFDYHDGNSHLLGAIIQQTTNQTLANYAETTLFEPLHIDEYIWEQHPDGLNYGAFGLYLTPRDFAKIGQLVLDKGIWKGEQILNEEWLQQSIIRHSNLDDEPYGWQWWIRPNFQAYTSAGHGGQYTYIIPDENLLIVYTAEPTVVYHEYGTDFDDFERIVELVVEAVK